MKDRIILTIGLLFCIVMFCLFSDLGTMALISGGFALTALWIKDKSPAVALILFLGGLSGWICMGLLMLNE